MCFYRKLETELIKLNDSPTKDRRMPSHVIMGDFKGFLQLTTFLQFSTKLTSYPMGYWFEYQFRIKSLIEQVLKTKNGWNLIFFFKTNRHTFSKNVISLL